MTYRMNLSSLAGLLDKTPVLTTWNPWLRIKLGESVAVFSYSEFRLALNQLHPMDDIPTLVLVNQHEIMSSDHPFLPAVQCTYDPFEDPGFEPLLVQNFYKLCSMPGVLVQSKVPDFFVDSVEALQPSITVLMIVDGLSFTDFLGASVIPCLVDGVSVTAEGMRRLVGEAHIAERLFAFGFWNRMGFSYWDRHNELSNLLFCTFTEGQLRKVESFDEVLAWFEAGHPKEGTYIQIVRSGLDEYAHNHRDHPPKEHVIDTIRGNVADLLCRLRRIGLPFLLFLTSDHGILWKSESPEDAVYLDEGMVPVRYYRDTEDIPESLRQVGVWHYRDSVFSLPVTHCRRKLRSKEWGSHGGVSIAESFVPLLRVYG
jgi:hypothetical protein